MPLTSGFSISPAAPRGFGNGCLNSESVISCGSALAGWWTRIVQNNCAAKPGNAREEAGAPAPSSSTRPLRWQKIVHFQLLAEGFADHYQRATLARALWTFSPCVVTDYRAGIVNTAAICKELLGTQPDPALRFMIWGIYDLRHLQFGAFSIWTIYSLGHL